MRYYRRMTKSLKRIEALEDESESRLKQAELSRIDRWYAQLDGNEAMVLELAYWAMWMGCWEKKNGTVANHMAGRANRLNRQSMFKTKADRCHRTRQNALQFLVNSPMSSIYSLQGRTPGLGRIKLCAEHMDAFKVFRDEWYKLPRSVRRQSFGARALNPSDYYRMEASEIIDGCSNCKIDRAENFYAVAEILVESSNGNVELIQPLDANTAKELGIDCLELPMSDLNISMGIVGVPALTELLKRKHMLFERGYVDDQVMEIMARVPDRPKD